jgi:hypothetical protein
MSAMSDGEVERYLMHNKDWQTLRGERRAESGPRTTSETASPKSAGEAGS